MVVCVVVWYSVIVRGSVCGRVWQCVVVCGSS